MSKNIILITALTIIGLSLPALAASDDLDTGAEGAPSKSALVATPNASSQAVFASLAPSAPKDDLKQGDAQHKAAPVSKEAQLEALRKQREDLELDAAIAAETKRIAELQLKKQQEADAKAETSLLAALNQSKGTGWRKTGVTSKGLIVEQLIANGIRVSTGVPFEKGHAFNKKNYYKIFVYSTFNRIEDLVVGPNLPADLVLQKVARLTTTVDDRDLNAITPQQFAQNYKIIA